ncbi:hypothetical protein BGX21_008497 [Mortierella sp. AD011]|nr:hypothetical protein BGX21_008497 [Mortierella sp. AD011]
MTDSLVRGKALSIPEIRNRVSRFVTTKDATSCSPVCNAWSNTFFYPIWYPIDFKAHTTFEDVAADVACKHEHHIRVINNILALSQLNIILSIKNNSMDMSHVEKSLWKCSDLKVLRARIKGLDTAEKIDRALQLWVEGRKVKDEKMRSQKDKQCRTGEIGGSSIEERVARHLLAFDKLGKGLAMSRARPPGSASCYPLITCISKNVCSI